MGDEAEKVLKFWFEESSPKDWYSKNDEFDNKIRERFSSAHEKLSSGQLEGWMETARGALAAIIVLDQLSRNMFRDSPRAFEHDERALQYSKMSLQKGYDKEIGDQKMVQFMILPHMHSERLEDHDFILPFYQKPGWEYDLEWEVKHREIIAKFGRYPHRNAVLGRSTTAEEEEFLKTNPGF